jgi:hypothetical protein
MFEVQDECEAQWYWPSCSWRVELHAKRRPPYRSLNMRGYLACTMPWIASADIPHRLAPDKRSLLAVLPPFVRVRPDTLKPRLA